MVMCSIYWPHGEGNYNLPVVPRVGEFFTAEDGVIYKVKEVGWGFVKNSEGGVVDGKIAASIELTRRNTKG